ncbi:MAG: ComEA family DNA-binding protein, partial [Peptostreptococcaceae bacterium]
VNNKTEKNNSRNEKDEVILKKSEITVEIKGEVKTPKVYTLEEGAIINDLIEKAGGLTSEANISNINRAKILKNEDLIIVGNINSLEENIKVEGSNSGVITSVNSGGESSGTININTATSGELMNIDGVGEKTAQKIIDYREENGAFKTIEDIKNVDRIGDKTFENMKDQISC